MKQENKKLRIGITIGDVNGIGPELVLKAFGDQRLRDSCIPILYGSSRALNIYRKMLDINKFNYSIIPMAQQAQPKRFNIIECIAEFDRVDVGQPSELAGKLAHLAFKRAIEDAQHEELDALVTLPVDKATVQIHDETFTGHTEVLGKAFGVEDNLMMMVSDELRVGLVTNHLPIQEVPRNISTQRIIQKVKMMADSLRRDFNIPKPMIAVLGLNPHSGDNGILGKEEQEVIRPAIEALQKEGILAEGPYPADGYFGSLTFRKFHGTIAMYHDQGLVPFKLLAGYSGINFTAAMPFVRTSPDHGVAYNIAGKGEADPESFRKSIYLAMDIVRTRRENEELEANALDA